MAKIDLARRAEIGREKRARTRAQLLEAARSLYAQHPIESVTIDNLVSEAGLAKGTFYVHFVSLEELQGALADEMARQLDDLLQPARLALNDPIERIAGGSAAFIRAALRNRPWGALVAQSTAAMPELGQTARGHLMQDLRLADQRGQLRETTPELAFEIAIAILLQAIRSAAENRLMPGDLPAVIAAILRAIGVPVRRARDIAQRIAGQEVLIRSSDRRITKE
jgi:AcrR family transcriptional regulator